MLEQKKQRLVQQLDRLEETRRRVERGVANARDALHQRDVQLADQLALKEDLQRLTRLCQRQWQLDLEVCSHVPLFVVFFSLITVRFHGRRRENRSRNVEPSALATNWTN